MDTYSSGEEFVIKTRKPYTITKQRERWTEEEHNRFLEALKLYGRAWQRIEEHIGTKTAVQIRSHAQKFFSKLEKEALVKGVPVGQALDIDIPPPRPKRKPSNPYPRKTFAGSPGYQVGPKDGKYLLSDSSSHYKQILDLEKEPLPEKPEGEGKATHGKETQDDDCSEVLTQLQVTHSSPAYHSSRPKPPAGLGNACSFREFAPSSTKKVHQGNLSGSYVTVELNKNQNDDKSDVNDMEIEDNNNARNTLRDKGESMDDHMNCGLPSEEAQATQNYPRHVPVQVVDGNLETHSPDVLFQDPNFHLHRPNNLFASSSASATTTECQTNTSRPSACQSFHPFHAPFTSFRPNQENNQSFLHMSSTFSSLVVSTLLQNPAAHAAASFTATFWPYGNGKASVDSPASNLGGFSPRQMNSAPSVAAIAAATVAAATAWWASHGLLPLCSPLHGPFTCTPPSIGVNPSADTGQAPAARKGQNSLDPCGQDKEDPESSEALQAQHSASKSSSSDYEERPNSNSKVADNENIGETQEVQDMNKAKGRKLVDRSSCGSNTASSSDIETDGLAMKENAKEEVKESDNNNVNSESNARRSRSTSNSSDSWKEVSEGGRLAFQALFSRQVLPQSFSPPPDQKNQENKNEDDQKEEDEKNGATSLFDLNKIIWNHKESENGDKNPDGGLLTIGLGHGKLKARRTGFKPYKRCSVEAKESLMGSPANQCEDQGNKRLRLEGEVQFNI